MEGDENEWRTILDAAGVPPVEGLVLDWLVESVEQPCTAAEAAAVHALVSEPRAAKRIFDLGPGERLERPPPADAPMTVETQRAAGALTLLAAHPAYNATSLALVNDIGAWWAHDVGGYEALQAACGAGNTAMVAWLVGAHAATPTADDLLAAVNGGHGATVALLADVFAEQHNKGALASALEAAGNAGLSSITAVLEAAINNS